MLVAADRDGGGDGLRRWAVRGPFSDLSRYVDAIKADLTKRPVRTVADAIDRTVARTSIRCGGRHRPGCSLPT